MFDVQADFDLFTNHRKMLISPCIYISYPVAFRRIRFTTFLLLTFRSFEDASSSYFVGRGKLFPWHLCVVPFPVGFVWFSIDRLAPYARLKIFFESVNDKSIHTVINSLLLLQKT